MLELVNETTVDLARSGARHGIGAFETIRAEGPRPLLLRRHLARLARACEFLRLASPPPVDQMLAFIKEYDLLPSEGIWVLRLLAVDHRLIVTVSPWEKPAHDEVSIGISTQITRLSTNLSLRHKILAYLDNILLAREAAECGAFEAIALNQHGHLTDGGRTNFFVVKHGQIFTPPVKDGCLPGMIREVLVAEGIAQETSLRLDDLVTAEGCFLTNSLVEILPVSSLIDPAKHFTISETIITRARQAYERACTSKQ